MCGWYSDIVEEMQNEEREMNIQNKIDVIKDEIKIIKKRIEPQDCGHLYTTVDVLEHRLKELKKELKNA